MYKLLKKQQRIKELLQSLPDPTNHQQKLHIIDCSYRHPQAIHLPLTQQAILNKTLNNLMQNEQQKIAESMQLHNMAYCEQVQRKLQNYLYSKTPSKSLDLQSSPKKQLMNIHTLQEDRVYIERKYNCKLSYELHNILQATAIEQQSAKMKKRMASKQQSALISHLERQTKKEVPVDERQGQEKSNNCKLQRSNRSSKTLHNTKSTKLFSKYVRPTAINKQNRLKKYIITSHATEKNSPKK